MKKYSLVILFSFVVILSGCVNQTGFENGHYFDYYDGIKIIYLEISSDEIGEDSLRVLASEKVDLIKKAIYLVKKHSSEHREFLGQIKYIEVSRDSPSAAHYLWGGDKIVFNVGNVVFDDNCLSERRWEFGKASILVHELCHVKQYEENRSSEERECQAAQNQFWSLVVEKECV